MSARTRHLILLAAVASTLSGAGLAASSVTTVYPGTICQVALTSDPLDWEVQNRALRNEPYGVTPWQLYPDYTGYPYSVFAGATRVVCPLAHSPSHSGKARGALAYVTVKHCSDLECGRVTTSCTLYSMDRQGRIIAAATKSLTTSCSDPASTGPCLEPIPDLIELNLKGKRTSDKSSAYGLECTLGLGGAILQPTLTNIKLIEY